MLSDYAILYKAPPTANLSKILIVKLIFFKGGGEGLNVF